MSQFCRHNRFISECPICSKGTVLDAARSSERRPRSSSSSTSRRSSGPALARPSRGPYAVAGPYDGGRELRLERVAGGLRLASWRGGQLERSAPVLDAADLPTLLAKAIEREVFAAGDAQRLHDLLGENGEPAPAGAGSFGRSPGRSGELRDELRVEPLEDGQLRIARWVMRPNRGWELQQAPVMLPPARLVQALADAAARGLLPSGQPTA